MPGLVGLITRMPREWAEAQLLRMLETLRHESFYVSGTWIDESSRRVRRAGSHGKGPFAEAMPLRNERSDVTLVFSGEEFPEPGTVKAVETPGTR